MGNFTQAMLVAGLIAMLSATSVFVEFAPPILSFVLAAAAALGWCVWLDRHPTA